MAISRFPADSAIFKSAHATKINVKIKFFFNFNFLILFLFFILIYFFKVSDFWRDLIF